MSLENIGEANFNRLSNFYHDRRNGEAILRIRSQSGTLLLYERTDQSEIIMEIIGGVEENIVSIDELGIDNKGFITRSDSHQISTVPAESRDSTIRPKSIIEMADRIIRESRRRPKEVRIPTQLPA